MASDPADLIREAQSALDGIGIEGSLLSSSQAESDALVDLVRRLRDALRAEQVERELLYADWSAEREGKRKLADALADIRRTLEACNDAQVEVLTAELAEANATIAALRIAECELDEANAAIQAAVEIADMGAFSEYSRFYDMCEVLDVHRAKYGDQP